MQVVPLAMVVPVSIDLDSPVVEWVWLDFVMRSCPCFMTVVFHGFHSKNSSIDGT